MEITKSIEELENLSLEKLTETRNNLVERLKYPEIKNNPNAKNKFVNYLDKVDKIMKSKQPLNSDQISFPSRES